MKMRKQQFSRRSIQYPLSILIFLFSCSKTTQQPHPPIAVNVATAISRDAILYADYIGHAEANLTLDVLSQIEGTITGKYYTDGQEVNENDLLFTIDTRPYQAALAKAEAVLAQNVANLKYAKETVRRYSKLVQDEYVSQLNYDQYVTTMLVDEATIKQNLADIETAKLNLEYCTIRAPWKGYTGKTAIDVGNYVSVGGSSPLVTLTQVSPILIDFYIPEKDFPRIQELQALCPLKTRIKLNTTKEFVGELTLIDNTVNQQTGTILLEATYDNVDKGLWPGQFVDVRLVLGTEHNATLVPNQAVQLSQDGSFVFVVKQDLTVEVRTVTVSQKQDDEMVIVKSGLKPGERVVTNGQINLYPGAKVEIQQ